MLKENKMRFRFYAALALLTVLAIGIARGQDASAFADTKLYDAVLDRLFQHDVLPGSSEIQLRYAYCDKGEMQIVIHKVRNSDFSLEVWYVADSPNVWKQLAGLVQPNRTLTPESAASLIKINHKTVVARSSTTLGVSLDKAASLSIPLLNPSTVTLDGMAYAISIRSISEDASLTFQGPQQAEQSDNQLIRWMGQVRLSVESEIKGK
jgi:hypothetical protein